VGGKGIVERKESNVGNETELEAAIEKDANAEFTKPTTFRTSIMQVLATGDLGDKFGIALVAKVKGDASEVWAKVDKAKSNQLEFEEVRNMLINQLGFSEEQCTDDEVMTMVRVGNRVCVTRQQSSFRSSRSLSMFIFSLNVACYTLIHE
jgi:hypothetical protein